MTKDQQKWAEQLKLHQQQKTVEPEEKKSISELNEDIHIQLDRIYELIDQKKSPLFIKVEFKRYVELVSQKAILQKATVAAQGTLSEEQKEEHFTIIEDDYKDTLASVAVGIDDMLGLN